MLPEVPKSDTEDDNDSLPPVKKARPSVDPKDLNKAEE
jgi:hypothetical protein